MLKSIIFNKRMLKLEDAQEIANINHQIILLPFLFRENIFNRRKILNNNSKKYVINPANERGILY